MSPHPFGPRHHLIVDDQDAVIETFDETFDHHNAGARLAQCDRKELPDFILVLEVDTDAAPVIAVEWFDDDRITNPPGLTYSIIDIAYREATRHRNADLMQQLVGELLIAGGVDRDVRGC